MCEEKFFIEKKGKFYHYELFECNSSISNNNNEKNR